MADGGGIKGFFKEKVWPLLKMFPKALGIGLVVGLLYWVFVNTAFRWHIYFIGVGISTLGFYVVVLLARRIKKAEYPEEALAEEPLEGEEEEDEEEFE